MLFVRFRGTSKEPQRLTKQQAAKQARFTLPSLLELAADASQAACCSSGEVTSKQLRIQQLGGSVQPTTVKNDKTVAKTCEWFPNAFFPCQDGWQLWKPQNNSCEVSQPKSCLMFSLATNRFYAQSVRFELNTLWKACQVGKKHSDPEAFLVGVQAYIFYGFFRMNLPKSENCECCKIFELQYIFFLEESNIFGGFINQPGKTRKKCALAQRASRVAARCKNQCVHAYMQRAGTTLLFLAAVERI